MKISFTENNGLYVSEFKPESAGTLFYNQVKGGDISIYVYVDGVRPILVEKNTKRKKSDAFNIDLTGVVFRIESTTEMESCVFTGDGRMVVDNDNILCWFIDEHAVGTGTYCNEPFKFGDIIPENSMIWFMFLTQEQYDKMGNITAYYNDKYTGEERTYAIHKEYFMLPYEDAKEALESRGDIDLSDYENCAYAFWCTLYGTTQDPEILRTEIEYNGNAYSYYSMMAVLDDLHA